MNVQALVLVLTVMTVGSRARVVVKEARNWFDARSYCYGKQLQLFGSNKTEATELRSGNPSGWYGGNRLDDLQSETAVWKWEHSQQPIEWFNWKKGHPNNWDKTRYCMYVDKKGFMIDLPCETLKHFHCA